jgi:hypothetical protein
MFYIHHTTCISPQQTFPDVEIEQLKGPEGKKLMVIEPSYEAIPAGILRRMGKAVRIGVGAAVPLIKKKPDGIIIGTANGGMEDCIKFLNQIIDYDEGMLTPGNFVQSTTNAIAGQLGLMSANKGYNITHVHRALAFENAAMDAVMMIAEHPGCSYLLGGVDEISTYNYNIEDLGDWYKKETISNSALYAADSVGSIAGEGAAMFLVNDTAENALAEVKGIHLIHSDDERYIAAELKIFLEKQLSDSTKPDLLLTGENGDNRLLKYYTACETVAGNDTIVARFKHMTGEYPTASAVATWLACHILQVQHMPEHMIKKAGTRKEIKNILIYNNYKGLQHSFILLSTPQA